MKPTIEIESTLTDRFQTTVPAAVRQALKLGKRDKIRYVVQPDGPVILTRATPDEDSDPVLNAFLRFLANEIAARPQHLQGIDSSLVNRVQSLVESVEIDINAPLSAEDE